MATFVEMLEKVFKSTPSVLNKSIEQVQQTTQIEQVDSSAINEIGYDPTLRVLTVEFIGGEVYQYYNVSTEMYSALQNAGSKGTWINKVLKQSFAPYVRTK